MKNKEILYPVLDELDTMHTVCLTGHRPARLPTGETFRRMLDMLHAEIDYALSRGYTCFFDGMAEGIDYHAGMYLVHKRKENPAIRIIGVEPCQDYEEFFLSRDYSLVRLQEMRDSFTETIRLPYHYFLPDRKKNDTVFKKRNNFMLDHSGAVLAVCGARRTGSSYTFYEGRKRNLPSCRIAPVPDPETGIWTVEKNNF